MKILVTGVGGFIGYHTALKYINSKCKVVGVDNLNDYYDVSLKHSRLKELGISIDNISVGGLLRSTKFKNFEFIRLDINEKDALLNIFGFDSFDIVIHLAAQAGVRYSIVNPSVYVETNVSGFFNVIEFSRLTNVNKFLYASSSSVYGISDKEVLTINDKVDKPESIYAATKKANELIAHAYSKVYNLTSIGLRFFTVYGPWGRPDMAPMIFTRSIINDEAIDVYNNGMMQRDFTYVDDIIESIYRLSKVEIQDKYSIFNIGNGQPVNLLEFISLLEKNIGKMSLKVMKDMQVGDVVSTHADTSELFNLINYRPQVGIEKGVEKFIDWYLNYYRVV